jgi:hypothetical protein
LTSLSLCKTIVEFSGISKGITKSEYLSIDPPAPHQPVVLHVCEGGRLCLRQDHTEGPLSVGRYLTLQRAPMHIEAGGQLMEYTSAICIGGQTHHDTQRHLQGKATQVDRHHDSDELLRNI